MKAYYNEIDPKAAAWLRELVSAGLIADGDVDERSIEDVLPADLAGYTQCHFFAGIGGWSFALRLAGIPDTTRVWTGSCPCQPFSAAGKGKGFADERHLWPAWHHLIRECRPQRIFGEQVAGALGWLDLVSTDLEAEGYAVGAAIVGAHSVGAPHIRQRLYWLAHSDGRRQQKCQKFDGQAAQDSADGNTCRQHPDGCGELGYARQPRDWRDGGAISSTQTSAKRGVRGEPYVVEPAGVALVGCWQSDWIACSDGKSRPVESGTFPLAHGVPGRVGLLRGYGNAIVPQDAAEFIMAHRW